MEAGDLGSKTNNFFYCEGPPCPSSGQDLDTMNVSLPDLLTKVGGVVGGGGAGDGDVLGSGAQEGGQAQQQHQQLLLCQIHLSITTGSENIDICTNLTPHSICRMIEQFD